ncbi:MAG: 4Fe-4S binding protein [Desulfuromonadaceae bacterium]|nr:4Fe-4S binding protein [Desulfuromonadaceae bacterium]
MTFSHPLAAWRGLVQWLFLLWVLYLGIRLGLFVEHFTSGGLTPAIARPTGVDGFLPIGGLVSLKYWLLADHFDTRHPAALVLLLTFMSMSFLTKKSFCSWLCPVGTLSEGLWKLGQRLFGRNFVPWRWLDRLLCSLKYLLLAFFVKILWVDMMAPAIGDFLRTPYWAVSDIKMLHFFTHPSRTTLLVLGVLVGLSLLYRNVWCRYLCPYGALLGVLSLFSPFKIRRQRENCTDCRQCSRACPFHIQVHRQEAVCSTQCTGCLSCVESCPTGCLSMKPPLPQSVAVPRWLFPLCLLLVYVVGVGLGMATGHWHSDLTAADYQHLIPLLQKMQHY